jgi:mRNA interferase MazF
MKKLQRGMVVDLNLDPSVGSETGKTRPCVVVTNDDYNARVPVIQVTPLTGWNEKKARIVTNVMIEPTRQNGLTKTSVADCLQTRPVDFEKRLVKIRGHLNGAEMRAISEALRIVFAIDN